MPRFQHLIPHKTTTTTMNTRSNPIRYGDDITLLKCSWQRKHSFRYALVVKCPFKTRVYPRDYSQKEYREFCRIYNKSPKKTEFLDMTFVRVLVPTKRSFPYECVPIEWCLRGKYHYPQYPNYKARAQLEKYQRRYERVNAVLALNQVMRQDGGLIREIATYL